MKTCFQSVQHRLEHRIGYFDLLGFDFMLDDSLNVRRPYLALQLIVITALLFMESTAVTIEGKQHFCMQLHEQHQYEARNTCAAMALLFKESITVPVS